MATTKKVKTTHLADQESTGIEVPAELAINIDSPIEQEAQPKAAKRIPKSKAPKTEGETFVEKERKPRKHTEKPMANKSAEVREVPAAEAAMVPTEVPSAEESAVLINPAETIVPQTSAEYTQDISGEQVPKTDGQDASNPEAKVPNGETPVEGENGQQNPKFQQNGRFNKFDKKNKFNKFDKNNRNNNRPQQQEEQEDAVPLPEPDSEAWCKARDCWAKYRKMTMSDLQELASQKENLDFRRYRKQSLGLLLQSLENENNIVYAEGLLEVTPQGHGFLRNTEFNYQQGPDDVYVSQNLIRRFGLKVGDTVAGLARPPRDGDKFYALRRVDKVNFDDPEKIKRRVAFEYLTPIHPNEKIRLEHDSEELTTRVMDLFSPIGKGQRSIILAPPRTGKTILLQNMTRAIAVNHPEVVIMVLLIDERPEEVTEMREIVGKLVEKNPALKAEVVASTFDEPPDHHARVATMVLEKAKRLVEQQKDVVVLLDSITRFARANNVVIPHSGKILSGGVDAMAMQFPKKFFGAARKIADKLGDFKKDSNGQVVQTIFGEPVREIVQKNGSLTIIGTALIETGSRMDEVIFEEFKGTGNMELVLDRLIGIYGCFLFFKYF